MSSCKFKHSAAWQAYKSAISLNEFSLCPFTQINLVS
nr:MAG TPA: hypothetical protein [Caudoviricetes sp.]